MGRPYRGWVIGLVLSFRLLLAPAIQAETIYVRADYSTIQEAIDAAADGDEIVVEPDFYLENIDFLGKRITVRSSGGPDTTILNGSGLTRGSELGSTVVFISGEDDESVLEEFTINDGVGSEATSGSGAAIVVAGGVLCNESSPRLVNLIVARNQNEAIYLMDSAAVLDGVIVSEHDSVVGAGIYIGGTLSDVSITNCRFEENSATVGGGLCLAAGTLRIAGTSFIGNSAGIGAGAFLGGEAEVSESVFRENIASLAGGAVVTGASVLLERCEISSNEASFGAGIAHSEGTLQVVACLIEGNEAAQAGGAYRGDPGEELALFRNCTITRNSAPSGSAFHLATQPTASEFEIELSNCIVWDNGDDPVVLADGELRGAYSDFEGRLDGTGNLDQDPSFADPSASDFTLAADSPCIDAGDPASPPDPDGTVADMGCFPTEQLPRFRRGDSSGNGTTFALGDALYLLEWQFSGGPAPPCFDAADADDGGVISALLDALYLLEWSFDDGPDPPEPGPIRCGSDPTADALGCAATPDC